MCHAGMLLSNGKCRNSKENKTRKINSFDLNYLTVNCKQSHHPWTPAGFLQTSRLMQNHSTLPRSTVYRFHSCYVSHQSHSGFASSPRMSLEDIEEHALPLVANSFSYSLTPKCSPEPTGAGAWEFFPVSPHLLQCEYMPCLAPGEMEGKTRKLGVKVSSKLSIISSSFFSWGIISWLMHFIGYSQDSKLAVLLLLSSGPCTSFNVDKTGAGKVSTLQE